MYIYNIDTKIYIIYMYIYIYIYIYIILICIIYIYMIKHVVKKDTLQLQPRAQ